MYNYNYCLIWYCFYHERPFEELVPDLLMKEISNGKNITLIPTTILLRYDCAVYSLISRVRSEISKVLNVGWLSVPLGAIVSTIVCYIFFLTATREEKETADYFSTVALTSTLDPASKNSLGKILTLL